MVVFEKLERAEQRFLELEKLLADPQVISNQSQYSQLAKEFAGLTDLIAAFREYRKISAQFDELTHLLKEKHDKDFEELAKLEMADLSKQKEDLLVRLDDLLNPKEQEKNRDVIIEIRAGTGGEEASLFAGDLYRMYVKYAEKKGWKVELMSMATSEKGGFKEVVFSVGGPQAEKRLRWESGAHRVQRVPTTEQSGRIHTSAATVAVLEEPEEVEININPSDLKIDVFRASGPGGQSVNTTDSAVRLTHMPTGVVVVCQDERSQLKNRAKAMRVLRARLMDKMRTDNVNKTAQDRKAKIGTGDRSEKIRTYNFPDRRVTDHRIGFTSHQLPSILDGDLDDLTDALIKAEEVEKLKNE